MEPKDILRDLQTPTGNVERPTAITVICIIGFIGAGLAVFGLLGAGAVLGMGYTLAMAVVTAMGLISMLGFWKMKKWGVYLYALMAVTSQIVAIAMGAGFSLSGLLIPAIILAIGFKYLNQMS